LASSEGSPLLPSPWEVLCKGSLSLKATLGSREVGLGEEQVSSLIRWGDVPMRDFLEQPHWTAQLVLYNTKTQAEETLCAWIISHPTCIILRTLI